MIHYSKTLTPSQSLEMHKFLHTLLQAGKDAKEAGVKPDVSILMKAWIGLPITEQGKRQRRLAQRQGWRKRKRAVGGKR